ncbi:MAG: DNA translocase FtsK [Chloroflexota bacterium]|nr:DNA translocase FtsK [Chloroflexota bacterium]
MAKTRRAAAPAPRPLRMERWDGLGLVGILLTALGLTAFIGLFSRDGFVVAASGAAFIEVFGRAASIAAIASVAVGPALLLNGVRKRPVIGAGHVVAAVVFVLGLAALVGLAAPEEALAADSGGWIGRFIGHGLAASMGGAPAYALLAIATVAAVAYALLASTHGAAATRLAGRLLINGAVRLATIAAAAGSAAKRRLGPIFRPQTADKSRRAPEPPAPAVDAPEAVNGSSKPEDWEQGPLIRTAPTPAAAPAAEDDDEGPWTLPPMDLMRPTPPATDVPDAEIRSKAQVIVDTLSSFNIEASVPEAIPGPVVTQYLVRPGTGVKVARITALANDLALKLAARSLRIEAPVPGRPYLGIELPNDEPLVVSVREVMEAEAWVGSRANLKLALGKDVAGMVRVVDLTAMPHLLIAGSTGAGKSVCLTSLITGLLCQTTPDELHLVLIDPKMVELVTFDGVPHLRMPVVTDIDDAVPVLTWVSREMARRYRIFNKAGVRNITSYNANPTEATDGKPLPYLVTVIDELADLMMTAPGDVERLLARLAQLARATGIHLVVSTQRPSVDVVTGLIKANFPTRISFMVSSQADSRTILDGAGAERLIGRGDMLFAPPEGGKPIRVQGVYTDDAEINGVVDHWREQGEPQRLTTEDLQEAIEQGDSEEDELYVSATELVMRHESITPDLLSRELQVGRSKAQKLAMQLEAEGFVGPPEPQSARRPVLQRSETA